MRLLSVFLLIGLVFAGNSLAEDQPMPFVKGETVTYAVKKLGFKAGQASLTFQGTAEVQGKPALLIVFKADGFNFYDEEKIFVDPKTFAPIEVQRDVNIFGSKEKIKEQYLDGKIKIVKTVAGETKEQIIEKKGQVDNIYGVIYRYRLTGSFKEGDKVALRLPTKDITLKLENKVKMSAGGKVYDAFYMSSNPGKYQIWFDASDKRIPLRITGAVGMANTTMIMIEYKDK